ncbi:MAG TPA: sigma-70 family RNA polymerase sigma factor [Candidatus Eisenbacteria bacterium]|nr:sigma-70 family RNA polymerase sigma factor [Candidatus Eisenbacteria bacterium]
MRAATAPQDDPGWDRTEDLLAKVRAGDQRAENILFGRYYPALRRWAHGRLPARARGLYETQDIVQVALMNAFKHVRRFENRYRDSFHMFLRTIVSNEIRGAIRKANRRPATEELAYDLVSPDPSPLQIAIGSELYERYEKALPKLSSGQQEAIVLFEMGFTYNEIGRFLDLDANTARMRVSRAIVRLAQLLGRSRAH